MYRSITYLNLFVLLLCIFVPAYSQSNLDSLSSKLEAVVHKDSIPGMAVILANDRQVYYQKSVGFADVQIKAPYQLSTIQNIGSVSKSFISVALMKAVELKLFTLDKDINDILPFKVTIPGHPNDKVTIRQLTTHTSGIVDNPDIYPNTYRFDKQIRPFDDAISGPLKSIGYNETVKDKTIAEFFSNYLSANGKYYSTDNFDPDGSGANYRYSNLGSALAAYLIEIRSGMSYAAFTEKYILKPLKMSQSGWFIQKEKLKQYAQLYYNGLRIPLYSLLTYPDGGLRTTAADMSKYLIEMIKGYKGQSKLLSAKSFQEIFKRQLSATKSPGKIQIQSRNKGLFWNIYNTDIIAIDGDDPGISTYLFFNTKTGKGGLFLCNTYLADKEPVFKLLVEAVSK